MEQLPPELVLRIFAWLDNITVIRSVSAVCRSWRALAHDRAALSYVPVLTENAWFVGLSRGVLHDEGNMAVVEDEACLAAWPTASSVVWRPVNVAPTLLWAQLAELHASVPHLQRLNIGGTVMRHNFLGIALEDHAQGGGGACGEHCGCGWVGVGACVGAYGRVCVRAFVVLVCESVRAWCVCVCECL